MSHDVRTRLSAIRRAFHRHPEPGWCEFRTTDRIVEELERIGVDELAVGREALATDHRMAVPSSETIDEWHERAAAAGADEEVLSLTADGHTGCVAVLERGEGPTVGLRVDMDGVSTRESDEPGHRPADEGFRSEVEGYMHACGHDAHAAIGLGVVEAVKESDFSGTFKCFFQPAEEIAGGGKPMAEGGYVDDVEYLFACHLGTRQPDGNGRRGREQAAGDGTPHGDVRGGGRTRRQGSERRDERDAGDGDGGPERLRHLTARRGDDPH